MCGGVRRRLRGCCAGADDDDDDAGVVPLVNVKGAVLEKILEYCRHHVEEPAKDIPVVSAAPHGAWARLLACAVVCAAVSRLAVPRRQCL